MHCPEHWPPSLDLEPLVISFHLVPTVARRILSAPESINFFKRNEPIGCRDWGTVRILEKEGINAYFSGCLTLVLERSDFVKKRFSTIGTYIC